MKKTLIALAAVAVSSAAMAQVTISGNVSYRYQSASDSAGATTKGFGVSDALLNASATEDLGGGLKLTASTGFDIGTEDTTVASRGVNLTLAGDFGSVTFSGDEGPDYLPIDFMATTAGGHNGSKADRIIFVSPSFSGFKATVAYADNTGSTDGAGASGAGNATTAIAVDYAAGPLALNFTTVSADKINNTVIDGATGMRASYNLGIATVSYGSYNSKSATGVKTAETAIVVAAPINSALTVSMVRGTTQTAGAAKYAGNQFIAAYALSKRTSVSAETLSYDTSTGIDAKRTRFNISHNF